MDEQLSLEKKLTVSSLLLHAIVLLSFATISFSIFQPQLVFSFIPIAYFGVMGVMAISLSGQH
jgi:hypothetical protein